MQSTFEQLVEEITFRSVFKENWILAWKFKFPFFRRRKETRLTGDHYSAHQSTTYWTDLFVRHFLFQNDYEADRDDLLFFIRKGNPPVQGSLSKHNKQHTTVEVCLDV